jgi:hypothetical protein
VNTVVKIAAVESDQIDRLRSLTQDLLHAARAGEWDTTTQLEAERRPLLYQVFGAVTPGQHIRYRALLQDILSVDREVMLLAQCRRDELAGLLHQVGHGRSALKAYESNTR